MLDATRINTGMAGSGNVHAIMTNPRKLLVRALHEQRSLSEIRDMLGLSEEALQAEITALVAASLVGLDGDTYRPLFFIADAAETQRAAAHATATGALIFEQLKNDWASLADAYSRLSLSRDYPFADVAYLLIGANILDIGLLECLAHAETLLPPAPSRPSPDDPDAHYYFWMVEGPRDILGKHGQNSMSLPLAGWSFFTFGQYFIGQAWNEIRSDLQAAVLAAAKAGKAPHALAAAYDLILVEAADIAKWTPVVMQQATRIMAVYLDQEAALRDFYGSLCASDTAPDGFSDFFCWYDHVAYAEAIDRLEQAGLITIPQARFAAALWQGAAGPEFF